jgi:myo-inositol-1-phosphate synthase
MSYTVEDERYDFTVEPKKSKRLGVLIAGICGNNGTTLVSGLMSHWKKSKVETKEGEYSTKFYGSISQYGVMDINGTPTLYKDLIDLYDVSEIILHGWDIVNTDLYTATVQNKVIDVSLREQLKEELECIRPLASIYYPSFIAKNQESSINNISNDVSNVNKVADVLKIKSDIDNFKAVNQVDDVVVVWSGSTERFSNGKWRTTAELIKAVNDNDAEVSPSMIFAMASIFSKSIFLNCSPQNTLSQSIIELAEENGSFVGGEDLKTGQTKLKSVLADFLVSSCLKPLSIVSYNHLGNNDGKNLEETPQFLSKEITKRTVIDDVVDSNPYIFGEDIPDHTIVIKYVPAVGDSKRALDEYYSELFLNGRQTIAIHNTCEDSLLAVPVMLDIILFSEFFSRVRVSKNGGDFKRLRSCLSLLSFFFKSPVVNQDEKVVNSFFAQKYGFENFLRLVCKLPINDNVNIGFKV